MAFADIDPVEGDRIVVNTQWTEKELIKQVPGILWKAKLKCWVAPLSWASCMALRGALKDRLQIGENLQRWAWSYRQNYIDAATQLRPVLHSDYGALPLDDERLYPFQRAGVQFMLHAGDVLLADEMGTGKTIQTLVALRQFEHIARQGEATGADVDSHALPALIICPNSVKRHWAREAKKWFPEATPHVIGNTAAKRRKSIDEASKDPNALVIINIEAVRLVSRLAPYGSVKLTRCQECDPKFGDDVRPSRCDVHEKELNRLLFKSVVFDEAHRIKEPKTAQTRATWALMSAPGVKRRIGLTGTPLAQHPGDLWSIMHGVAPYDFPAKSKYVDRYCMSSWNEYGGIDIVGIHPEHKDELFSFLDPHFRRVTKAEVLPQLPNKIRETRYVEMTAAQGRMYRDIEKKLQTRTEDGQLLIAPNQLAKALRLMQLASATSEVVDDPASDFGWAVRMKTPSPKIDELEAVLNDLGDGQCVVAAEHKQLINLAAERLTKAKIPHALITGDISEYERDKALEMLHTKQIRCLLFTVKAGGTGLNMSSVDTLVNLQRSWSMIDCVQTEDRVHRIGSEQHQKVRIIDIVTKDTIEESQIERIMEKFEKLDQITRDRQRLIAMNHDTSQLDHEYAKVMNTFIGVPHGDA